MNVVDSSGWLEYLRNGTNADFFSPPIRDAENLVIPTVCLFDVFKRVPLDFGEDRAIDTVGNMYFGTTVDLTHQIAIDVALLSTELKLSMADSILLATARSYDATLWTQDAHFMGLENVMFIEKKT